MAKSSDTITTFLADCRQDAATSAATAQVVENIETKIGTLRADRAKLEGQLQDAVVAGADLGKLHTLIAQLDQDLMTLQAAVAGFTSRRGDQEVLERAEETAALLQRSETLSGDLLAKATEFGAAMRKARDLVAEVGDIYQSLDHTNTALVSRGKRPAKPASAIVREAIGPVSRSVAKTSYGQRNCILLAEIMEDNPIIARRAQNVRRGRVGESRLVKDQWAVSGTSG